MIRHMNRSTRRNRLPRGLAPIGLAAIACLSLLGASAASAATGPAIRVSMLKPDVVTPGKPMVMWVNVLDVGDEALSGNLTIRYTFPAGVAPEDPVSDENPFSGSVCTPPEQISGQVDECVIDITGVPLGHTLSYKTNTSVDPGATGTLTGQVEVWGGGASNAPDENSPVAVPLAFETDPVGPFDIDSFDVGFTDNPAQQSAQAGSVPTQIATAAQLRSQAVANFGFPSQGAVAPPENMRDVIVHVPPGLVGYPTATPAKCTAGQLDEQSTTAQVPTCPRDSQIGLALVNGKDTVPLYNLVPPRGAPAEFGFYYQGLIVYLRAKVRPSDNGIDIVTSMAPSAVPIPKFEVQLWGVPSDSRYDPVRADCTEVVYGASGSLCPSSAVRTSFLRRPTSCTGPLPWSIEVDTYQHPGVFHSKSTTTPALTGCDKVLFEPKVSLAPTTDSAHTTSGLEVDLTVPKGSGPGGVFQPDGISQADVRSATVALPQGVGLNPAAAEGLTACTDAQLRLGLEGPAECPESSKLGTVEIKTPLLDETLDGSVYLRTQNSQDPESGEMYRLAIVLHSAERGVDVKLPGSLVVNKETGQLTTSFDELPQLPFESMHLSLKAGPRAPLTTPQTCGSYSSQATLTGWNAKTVSLAPSFSVNRDCTAPGFAPGFEAGVSNPTAGAFSPFTLRVTRDPGQPNVSRIETTLPEGELAKLAGVPVCGGAAASAGICPAGAKIGSAIAGVGEGSDPLYIPQPGKAPTAVYLAGPYKGAPYSVVTEVPAQSGPFDLGTVTVRSALRVDPVTTRATVASDPLPQIFGGIPVSYRDVGVQVDRPEFTVNPTSCAPKSVTGTIAAATGQSANVSDRFQASDCAALGFKPKLALALKGATRRGANPALTATLRMPKGANVAAASVALPHSAFLDQSHIKTICTRVQFAADGGGGAGCPAASVYGRARAFTPLLDKPLEGPVYLRSSNHNLPDLVASLGGAIHVDLAGRIDSFHGGIRTSFEAVPDAPVLKFVLAMQGGKKGLIQNSRDLCLGANRATARFDGQNGRASDFRPLVKPTSCAGNARKKHRQG